MTIICYKNGEAVVKHSFIKEDLPDMLNAIKQLGITWYVLSYGENE
jgi:hypothetical protein|tara:strand:+ start:4716 stop:4853 length:138 start_codon:yes stop_codon:yes gene_type:complete